MLRTGGGLKGASKCEARNKTESRTSLNCFLSSLLELFCLVIMGIYSITDSERNPAEKSVLTSKGSSESQSGGGGIRYLRFI